RTTAKGVRTEAHRGMLRPGVGRHDRPREVESAFWGHRHCSDARFHLFHWKEVADDTRAADKHFRCRQAETCSGELRHAFPVGDAAGTGARVRDAGVDDDCPHRPGCQLGAIDIDRCRVEQILREGGCDRTAALRCQQSHVELSLTISLHPRVHRTGHEPLGRGDRPRPVDFVRHYGYTAAKSRPIDCGRPSMRFMFSIAWPAAPFTRLSSTPMATSIPLRESTTGCTRHWLLPSVCLVCGGVFTTRVNAASR